MKTLSFRVIEVARVLEPRSMGRESVEVTRIRLLPVCFFDRSGVGDRVRGELTIFTEDSAVVERFPLNGVVEFERGA